MPSQKNVGPEPKRIAMEVLESKGGEAASKDVRFALEDENYKYAPSVVLNELIEEGKVERRENGMYRLLNGGKSRQRSNQGQQRSQRGEETPQNTKRDRGSREMGRDRDQSRERDEGDSGQAASLEDMLDRLRAINTEERQMIDQMSDQIRQLSRIAQPLLAFVGQQEGRLRRREEDAEEGEPEEEETEEQEEE